ncbi:MAG: hypothetical protein EA370_17130 [Wenzhouxiangella sp.]|nr:MAG: hypothetical protein EA370_17130 [Wenzhouxiangella sp.]
MDGKAILSPSTLTFSVFLCSFFLAGIPFWQIPYSQVTVPNSFFGFGVVVVFSGAAVLAYRLGVARALLVAASVFPAILMARVLVEGFMDPTRHNLWPLALVIAMVLGLVVAGSGAAAGWLAGRLFRAAE